MKFLGLTFLITFLFSMKFAIVEINDSMEVTLIERIIACLIVSALFTLIAGLPLLGIAYLLGV